MKRIQLGGHLKHTRIKGYALIDDQDLANVSKYKWYLTNTGYAVTTIKRKGKRIALPMHRLILNVPKNMVTDHINGNGLDNRRKNIRICTMSQNSMNGKKRITNTSGHVGVYWVKKLKQWQVAISINRKFTYLGIYQRKKDAISARKVAENKYYGQFALNNRP